MARFRVEWLIAKSSSHVGLLMSVSPIHSRNLWTALLLIVLCNFYCTNATGQDAKPSKEPVESAFDALLADEAKKKQEREKQERADSQKARTAVDAKPPSRIPASLDVYMGRRIAQTMHYTGAEWLIRDEREREERCSLMLANLGVKPGMTICDMGCGNGYHTLQMAKMTGEQGMVVGVDVQPEMLGFLRDRMEKQGIENIIPILGGYHNPHLPPATIDMVLLVDVYHEFSYPEQMLASMRASLKPNGVIVLVEYREEDPKVPIKPLHKMSKAQVNKELLANGFKLVSEFDKLPWQHMMFFGKDESWTPKNAQEAQSKND
jgi:ubiquinone/menaquinone biosynthesis C-methylase UbiE